MLCRVTTFSSAAGLLLAHLLLAAGECVYGQELVTWKTIQKVAERAALQPFQPPLESEPWGLREADAQSVKPAAGKRLWAGEGKYFEIALLPPQAGPVVPVALLKSGTEEPLACSADWFDFSASKNERGSEEPVGFGGLVVYAPLGAEGPLEPLALLPAASDFWTVTGPGMTAGSTAGILHFPGAATPPRVTQWWIEVPELKRREWIAMAIVECPEAVAACRFRLEPGRAVSLEVQCHLILRQLEARPLLSPLRAQFLSSEFTGPAAGDWRPEVHSADGFLCWTGAKHSIWHPLNRMSSAQEFLHPAPSWAGWGLIQRDRSFDHFQDLNVARHRQPSLWVEPVEKVPPGEILLRLDPPAAGAAAGENILAGFRPAVPELPARAQDFTWRVQWMPDASTGGLSRVLHSRRAVEGPALQTWIIDFAPLANPADESKPPELLVEVDDGSSIVEKELTANPQTGGWRARLKMHLTDGKNAADVKCTLLRGGRPVSEQWWHRWVRE